MRWLAYRLLASDWVAAFAERTLHLIALIFGRRVAMAFVGSFGSRVVWSGWPYYVPGWTQHHASRLYWRLWNALDRVQAGPPRRRSLGSGALRIGCIGPFRGLLSFDRRFVECRPQDIELFIYDMEFDGAYAKYLRDTDVRYRALPASPSGGEENWARDLAGAVKADEIDLVVNINRRLGAYRLMDRIDAPCVAHVCTGSEVLHHARVDLQIYAQPQAAYRHDGHRLVCEVTDRPVLANVWPGWLMYDSRGLESLDVPAWRDRSPLIVFHGSLYKLDSAPYLNVLTRLLQEDSALEFVYMGRHRGDTLKHLVAQFERAGVAARAHYDGSFESTRNETGIVADEGWTRLVVHLQRARLAPNPWPIGGGSARVEAYLLGAPTVHMALGGVVDSPERRSLIDLPALAVPSATATSPDDYLARCRQCLTGESFATRVIDEQRAIALRVTDPREYWTQIERFFREWAAER